MSDSKVYIEVLGNITIDAPDSLQSMKAAAFIAADFAKSLLPHFPECNIVATAGSFEVYTHKDSSEPCMKVYHV